MKEDEALVDLSMEVRDDVPNQFIEADDVRWLIEYTNEELDYDERLVLLGRHRFQSLFAGTSYRSYACIRTDECSELGISTDILGLLEYSISVDGVAPDSSYQCPKASAQTTTQPSLFLEARTARRIRSCLGERLPALRLEESLHWRLSRSEATSSA